MDHGFDRVFPDDNEVARRTRAFDGSALDVMATPVTMNRSLAPRWPTVPAPGPRPTPSSRDVPLDRLRALIDDALLQAERTRRLIEAGRATTEHGGKTVTSSIQRVRHSREVLATAARHADLAAIVRRRRELTRMTGTSRVRV
jgi:hypothetical protein